MCNNINSCSIKFALRTIMICNLCRHAPITSTQTVDCQTGRSQEQHSVCGDDPSTCIQQSSQSRCYYNELHE